MIIIIIIISSKNTGHDSHIYGIKKAGGNITNTSFRKRWISKEALEKTVFKHRLSEVGFEPTLSHENQNLSLAP